MNHCIPFRLLLRKATRCCFQGRVCVRGARWKINFNKKTEKKIHWSEIEESRRPSITKRKQTRERSTENSILMTFGFCNYVSATNECRRLSREGAREGVVKNWASADCRGCFLSLSRLLLCLYAICSTMPNYHQFVTFQLLIMFHAAIY